MEEVKAKDLEELGVLRRGPAVEGAGAVLSGGHGVLRHVPVWAYENPVFAAPFADDGPLFDPEPPERSPEEALAATRLPVFLGATRTPLLDAALARRDAAVILLDPDPGRMGALLAGFPPRDLAARGVVCVQGDALRLNPPLARLLPEKLFLKMGCPEFFAAPELLQALPEWVRAVVEQIEFLCWRHRIYPVSGQFNSRGLPLRRIECGLFLDQQHHAYENAAALASQGNLRQVRDALKGVPAILAAAGPDLAERAEFLRANRDRAVIIAVNNALKPLLALGVTPHVVVINDNSLAARVSFEGLDRLPETILAAHCLSHAPTELFGRTFFFGAYKPEVFGARPVLRIYGSVITAAFSLARHLGCPTCVLAGVQLAAADPWRLTYARNSVHEAPDSEARPLVHRHPQLYPVRTPFGETLYSTLNFRDAALWFLDEVRATGVRCVNLSRRSILLGPGVEFDENPRLPARQGLDEALRALRGLPAPRADKGKIKAFLARERAAWANTAGPLDVLLSISGPEFVKNGMDVLEQLDRGNVTYLVQRFEDFHNPTFHRLVFEPKEPDDRERGLRLYLEAVRAMSLRFMSVIDRGFAAL
ncbi:MAG: DUF115 domain-containing protein [Desulfovibrionaceae bacterium]|nr:DUF115 domain-containing protein [Desulfovibrionaceae bacterium]